MMNLHTVAKFIMVKVYNVEVWKDTAAPRNANIFFLKPQEKILQFSACLKSLC